MKVMEDMLGHIRQEPGIPSAKLARKIGLSSLQCATLARRLAKRGFITVGKENRSLVYTIGETHV
jgi:predicted transcriptional regulator